MARLRAKMLVPPIEVIDAGHVLAEPEGETNAKYKMSLADHLLRRLKTK
ncbi:MAG TPA: hypothetical protein VL087_02645 [Nitrospirota bacterium]|nr:hypothetical protein [Nitrospirota bacterium]